MSRLFAKPATTRVSRGSSVWHDACIVLSVALSIAPKSAALTQTLLPLQTREEAFFQILPILVEPNLRHVIATISCTANVQALLYSHFICAFEMYRRYNSVDFLYVSFIFKALLDVAFEAIFNLIGINLMRVRTDLKLTPALS